MALYNMKNIKKLRFHSSLFIGLVLGFSLLIFIGFIFLNTRVSFSYLDPINQLIHEIWTWASSGLALIVVVFGFVHFMLKRDLATPVIVLSFTYSSVIIFLSYVSYAHFALHKGILEYNYTLVVWFIERAGNGIILIVGSLLMIFVGKMSRIATPIAGFLINGIAIAVAALLFLAALNLKLTYLKELSSYLFISPIILVITILSFFCLYKLYHLFPSVFSLSLMLSSIPFIFAQITLFFDTNSSTMSLSTNIAEFYRFLGFMIPFIGLVIYFYKTYKEIDTARENYKEISMEKSHMVSVISHDLKNPISVVKESIQLVLDMDQKKLTPVSLELLEMCKENTDFMLALVNDLLDVTLFTLGKLRLNLETVDLNELISKVVQSEKTLATKKKITLIEEYDYGFDKLQLDPGRIEEVFQNLLVNAIKFSYSGSKIIVKTFQEDENIIASIQDFGCGMAPEVVQKLFAIYEAKGQIRGQKGTEGEKSTGLGLYITKLILDSHQAQLEVISKQDEGSTFSIKFLKKIFVLSQPK